ncbi:MAG: hypothetical protein M1435_01750, partial [Actinobacteria bacterium]|nr:hypothetical protein [Actinomycetota bacterium]
MTTATPSPAVPNPSLRAKPVPLPIAHRAPRSCRGGRGEDPNGDRAALGVTLERRAGAQRGRRSELFFR